jgi:hypothetical protein
MWRADLPDDPQHAGGQQRSATAAPPRRERPAHLTPRQPAGAVPRSSAVEARARPIQRLSNAALVAGVVLIALLVTWVGMGDPSPRGAVVVAFVFGVPMMLTLLVVSVIARRHRR